MRQLTSSSLSTPLQPQEIIPLLKGTIVTGNEESCPATHIWQRTNDTDCIMVTMQTYTWYQRLKKPSWAPPSYLFGVVWSVLYVIIATSFGFVAFHALSNKITLIIALPFFLNVIFNLLFTPAQFGLRNNYLAAADIILVLVTLIWAMAAIWPFHPWVALVNIPYLLWVGFATILQLNITYLNR